MSLIPTNEEKLECAKAEAESSNRILELVESQLTAANKSIEELERTILEKISGWEKEANQYQKQIEECRLKNLPHECMLGQMTALRQCAKELKLSRSE